MRLPDIALFSLFKPSVIEGLAEEQELRRWGLISVWAVILTVLALLLWGIIAPLHGAVVAHGMLRVESERKIVQHQEGGLVKEILVKNGSVVKRGQLLILLEDLRVDANYDIIDQQYDAELAKTSRLEAERDFLGEIKFPGRLKVRQKIPLVADILRKEGELFRQRRKSLSLQIEILRQQIAEANYEISAEAEQVAADANGQTAARSEIDANNTLLQKGFIAPTRMTALQRGLSDYESRLGEHKADLSRAKQKQSDLRLKIEGLQSNYRETAVSELKEATVKLNELAEQIKPAQDAQQRQQVLSPVDGIVMDLKLHTIGASISPREPILSVVPQDKTLVVDAKLPLDAISELTLGMTADVRLSAFQQRTTPLVEGKLTYISADAVTDNKPNEPPYYSAEVMLDEKSVVDAKVGPLQPGMPVEVYLRTHPRNAIDYFLAPITQSLYRAFRER